MLCGVQSRTMEQQAPVVVFFQEKSPGICVRRQNRLHGSPISNKGACHVLNGLALHPNVVSLDLGDCQLSDACIPHIADLLPPNGAKRGLKDLTLSANPGITSKGWTHLFMGISSSSSIRVLNLDYNRIGCYGAGCLAVAMAANRTLEVVDLEGCGIEEFGARTLLRLIQHYPVKLKQLILTENKISRKTMDRISSGLSMPRPDTGHEEVVQDNYNVVVQVHDDTNSMTESSLSSKTKSADQSDTIFSEEVRNLNVIIREPTNIRILTDIPRTITSDHLLTSGAHRSLEESASTTPIPIIRTEVESSSSQDSEGVLESDSGRSYGHKYMISSNYSSSPGYNTNKHHVVKSSSRNTYDSMSTGEAVHAAYRKALQRKKRSK